jgi:hypothetical protein
MFKLLKIVGVLALLVSTVEHASALTFTDYTATSTTETYSVMNTGSASITLSQLVFQLFGTTTNLFSNAGPVTILAGTTFSETVGGLTVGASYQAGFSSDANPLSVTVGLSPVPLPAGFSLFVMALVGLGAFGYYGSRRNATAKADAFAA